MLASPNHEGMGPSQRSGWSALAASGGSRLPARSLGEQTRRLGSGGLERDQATVRTLSVNPCW